VKVKNREPVEKSVSESSSFADLGHYDSDEATKVPFVRAVTVLIVCLCCIAVLASMIIFFCTDLARSLGVDQSTLGATLVALGAEV
jgi:Ca2+/Na+ antiporter